MSYSELPHKIDGYDEPREPSDDTPETSIPPIPDISPGLKKVREAGVVRRRIVNSDGWPGYGRRPKRNQLPN